MTADAFEGQFMAAVALGAVAWVGAFALFLVRYCPLLWASRTASPDA